MESTKKFTFSVGIYTILYTILLCLNFVNCNIKTQLSNQILKDCIITNFNKIFLGVLYFLFFIQFIVSCVDLNQDQNEQTIDSINIINFLLLIMIAVFGKFIYESKINIEYIMYPIFTFVILCVINTCFSYK